MGPGSSQTTPVSPRRSQKGASTALVQETRLLPIRVLYTLNASPQFLLARQRRKVQVLSILEDGASEQGGSRSGPTGNASIIQNYAKVSLKACLGAVCNSSPELLSDRTRDYSVYVVDPLESSPSDGNTVLGSEPLNADTHLSSGSASSSPCPFGDGVSIGMGLMSWCLSDDMIAASRTEDGDDEGHVIGKLVRDRGAEALEVVMSLRETASQTQHQHALSLSSWGFQPGSTASSGPGYSSSSAVQLPSSFPSSPHPLPPSALPTSSQPSTTSTSPEKQCLSELEEIPVIQAPSSSIPDSAPSTIQPSIQPLTAPSVATKKWGRPPGTRMHPEKRARRLAVQSHREKLERMENIAKMQKGEAYDKTLIIASEVNGPKVTDEEIARQRKLLEELESRPLIVDQSSCLTTVPLPNRARSPALLVPLSKKVASKRKGRSTTPTNAAASGSGINQDELAGESRLIGTTHGVPEEQHSAGFLLSLLTSVLGKVDEPSAASATTIASARQDNGKGKAKETSLPVDNALTGALQRLLPLLPNNTAQTNAPTSHSCTQSPAPIPKAIIKSAAHASSSESPVPDPSQPPKSQRLFKTTEETFYSDPQRAPSWPYDKHRAAERSVQDGPIPKVREDAHPVPGGGWARGRNLVPRETTPQHLTPPPDRPAVDTSSDTTMRANPSTIHVAPEKENKPPTKTRRGLKRSLSSVVDAKENAAALDTVSSKTSTKKRKQNTTPAVNSNTTRSEDTKRTVMGSAESFKANESRTFGSGFVFAASSPARTTASTSVARRLPVMAMSEPDYLSPSLAGLPIVTSSDSSHPTIEPPRTPPRRDRLSDDDVGGSLFTPCAPASASRLAGNIVPLSDSLLFSPSPGHPNSHGSRHVNEAPCLSATTARDDEFQRPALESRHVSTGWDLPPSSPPPPTSPISPNIDLSAEQDDQMDLEFATQLQSELDVEMEKGSTDGRFEDHGATINCAAASTPAGGIQLSLGNGPLSDQPLAFHTPVSSSDFDPLSEGNFYFGDLGQVEGEPEGGQGIELDIEQLWSSLGPVIAQAHADSNITGNTYAPSQPEADFGFFGLGSDQTHVETEGQSGVDAVKLAEDLKALFGGCLV